MKLQRIAILVAVLFLMLSLAASQAVAEWNWRQNNKSTSLTAFYTQDTGSDQDGLGVSLTMKSQNVTDITLVSYDDYYMVQTSQLSPKHFGPFTAYWGLSLGYAKESGDASLYRSDVPDGIMSGVQLILGKTVSAYGLSVDLRASAMSEGFNPFNWVTDPDVLWLGAGVSYTF